MVNASDYPDVFARRSSIETSLNVIMYPSSSPHGQEHMIVMTCHQGKYEAIMNYSHATKLRSTKVDWRRTPSSLYLYLE